MKSKRVILDTNLWISFLISKRLQELDSFLHTGDITLLFSIELIEEFLEVSQRPKLKKYFTNSDIKALLKQIDNFSELVQVRSTISVCRDEKDNFLLSLAIDGKADFLITGDLDLLTMESFKKTKIVSWANFVKLCLK
ncbi:putative toxin-antitoxin system toxin component, PIN family [Cytophagales bacterium LB-30]|uniref:Toxin-antitoxin system toxin component, PIN family n=1 Tax=Shiella aurantiaca TaxID=3058365 RepID=A0ABT8F4J3_9BACT|nr:putative toxin-antitoxin system toxin component, PIN family [Shiella aurantiaca]MDN4165387.1 putative toxin-antitoxin system toxin component, PIN family [Shiella aurantiaca]